MLLKHHVHLFSMPALHKAINSVDVNEDNKAAIVCDNEALCHH